MLLGKTLTLSVPLSNKVYKWVPAIVMLGVTLLGLHSIQGGVEILLVSSRYRNRAPALLGHFTSYLFLQFGANSIDNGNIYVYKDVPLNIGGRFAWVLNFF